MKTQKEKVYAVKIYAYKGEGIYELSDGKFETSEYAPIIGVRIVGHDSLADAKKYIESKKS